MKIPSANVMLRYASQGADVHWCDELLTAPPDGATVLPVWIEVRTAKDQAPGWYASTLTIKANGKQFAVPVQVFVSALTVCDARDVRSLIYACHSPDTIALQYKLTPWSDEHFEIMEPSLAAMGQLGNDAMLVPVVLGSHLDFKHPVVRFLAKGEELVADVSLLERYIDLYLKHCAPPKAVVVYLWTGMANSRPPMPMRIEGSPRGQ